MARKRETSRTLTIFLAKPGTVERDLIDRGKEPLKTAVKDGTTAIGTLYSRPSHPRHPRWVSFFGDAIDPDQLQIWSSSAAAVLVLRVKERLFAVAFGYGKYLLNPQSLESTFGLRVTLNCVDPSGIRSIDRKTFEGITTHVREQASKETDLSGFGLDVERDLLRAVVGSPSDDRFGTRVAGMDALVLSCRTTLRDLPALLELCLEKAADETYRSRYPFISNIAELRDKTQVAALDAQLLAQIRAGDFSRKWLAVPDLMDWTDIGGFRYVQSDRQPLLPDIHLETYMEHVRMPENLTRERLRHDRVFAFAASTEAPCGRWSLYDCIYAEIDSTDGTFLLNGGSWFTVDRGFVATINAAVEAIPATSASLVPFDSGEKEEGYNKRLAGALGRACVMDRKSIRHGGGRSAIEFCDVLTAAGVIIHVKRYGGSSVLSHLFAQGTVSAITFLSDGEFRRALNEKLPAAFRFPDPLVPPRAGEYEVAFVIASSSSEALRLPFFSRVTLRNAQRQLQMLGYRVSLTKIGFCRAVQGVQ